MIDQLNIRKIFSEEKYIICRSAEHRYHLTHTSKKLSIIILLDEDFFNFQLLKQRKNCKVYRITLTYTNIYFSYSYIKTILRNQLLNELIK